MSELELFVVKRIKKLIPDVTKIDFRASVSEKTFSIEFFATINNMKHQCYDMVDEGLLDSKELRQCQIDIADYIRKSDSFTLGKINKFRFSAENIE